MVHLKFESATYLTHQPSLHMRTTYNLLLQISQLIEHQVFLKNQLDEITHLLERLDRQDINLNFIGPRNVGKSALINLLLHSDSAKLQLSEKLTITETPSETWEDPNQILSIAEDEIDFLCMVIDANQGLTREIEKKLKDAKVLEIPVFLLVNCKTKPTGLSEIKHHLETKYKHLFEELLLVNEKSDDTEALKTLLIKCISKCQDARDKREIKRLPEILKNILYFISLRISTLEIDKSAETTLNNQLAKFEKASEEIKKEVQELYEQIQNTRTAAIEIFSEEISKKRAYFVNEALRNPDGIAEVFIRETYSISGNILINNYISVLRKNLENSKAKINAFLSPQYINLDLDAIMHLVLNIEKGIKINGAENMRIIVGSLDGAKTASSFALKNYSNNKNTQKDEALMEIAFVAIKWVGEMVTKRQIVDQVNQSIDIVINNFKNSLVFHNQNIITKFNLLVDKHLKKAKAETDACFDDFLNKQPDIIKQFKDDLNQLEKLKEQIRHADTKIASVLQHKL